MPRGHAATVLRDAASAYQVDTEAITLKVKQESAAKAKATPGQPSSPDGLACVKSLYLTY